MKVCIDSLENAHIFTLIFQHIKSFSDFTNIIMKKEHLYIQAMDNSKISVFEVKLLPGFFSTYDFDQTENVGINVNLFYKILNVRDKNQKIELETETDDKLNIYYTSADVSIMNKSLQIPLVELDEELFSIPEMEYNVSLTVDSGKFADIINNLKLFDDTINIDCQEDKVVMGSDSQDQGKINITLTNENMKDYTITDDVAVSYTLKMLGYITIYNKVTDEVNIQITEGVPLKLLFKIDHLGSELVLHLAPKIND
jgi:proliferating cell nuclear antigen PCNA|uniref:Proliferating cell nuclear antigen PCNA N-terminal domain-containing protein n=1 Tax=viral metagenome TaxID=1070528 RepID=A0A6C0IPJ4_9ZZZZ